MATTFKTSVNFIDKLDQELSNTTNNFYVYTGRVLPWVDENTPDAIVSSYESVEFNPYRTMVNAKRITPNDFSRVIRRINWQANTIFEHYDHTNTDIENRNFYVITDENHVYKCLYNNNDARSIVKPDFTDKKEPFTLSDGYTWKYMYSLTTDEMNMFSSTEWIPVKIDEEVSNNAVSGGIFAVNIEDGGAGYIAFHEGNIQKLVNSTAIVLDDLASSNNNFYANSAIYLRNGMGAGQIRRITSYNSTNKTVTVTPEISTFTSLRLANVSGSFDIEEKVYQTVVFLNTANATVQFFRDDIIRQVDTGAEAKVLSSNGTFVSCIPLKNNAFANNLPIISANSGSIGLSGTVSISIGNTSVVGVGTTFNANGNYVVGDYIQVGNEVGLNTRRITNIANATHLTVDRGFTFNLAANNHYRVLAIASVTNSNTSVANGTIVFSETNGKEIVLSNLVGSFQYGEKILQTSGPVANGIVSFANSTSLRLSEIKGTFTVNNTIRGISSGSTSLISTIINDPNITLKDVKGNFVTQAPIITSGVPVLNMNPTLGSAYAEIINNTLIPNELTSFYISPFLEIDGDGQDFVAYPIIGGVSSSVERIEIINPGKNYNHVSVKVANSAFGVGGEFKAVISPAGGHGKNAKEELFSKRLIVSATFANTFVERFKFIKPSTIRTYGLIKDPHFNKVRITFRNPDRANISVKDLSFANSAFINNELVYQPSSNTVAKVVFSNSSFVQLENISNPSANGHPASSINTNSRFFGMTSGRSANCISVFALNVNNQIGSEFITSSGVTGTILDVESANTAILYNVSGNIKSGETIRALNSNATCIIENISLPTNFANNTNETYDVNVVQFGRLTITSNTAPYQVNDRIIQKDPNNKSCAMGVIAYVNKDIDLSIANTSGSFSVGQTITQNTTGASGTVMWSNSTFVKVMNVNGSFNSINHIVSSANVTANVLARYNVVHLQDVSGNFITGDSDYPISSNTSVIFSNIPFGFIEPDFIRNTGDILHINNISPITTTHNSKETVKILIENT